jgi:F0F1-type ATP synthase gamma subunit
MYGRLKAIKLKSARSRKLAKSPKRWRRFLLQRCARRNKRRSLAAPMLAQRSLFWRVSQALASLPNHPLTCKARGTNALYIVITSDKGLAGALNSAVLRAVWATLQKPWTKTHASIIAVGRKANDFFTIRGIKVEAYHPNTDRFLQNAHREIVDTAAAKRFCQRAR